MIEEFSNPRREAWQLADALTDWAELQRRRHALQRWQMERMRARHQNVVDMLRQLTLFAEGV